MEKAKKQSSARCPGRSDGGHACRVVAGLPMPAQIRRPEKKSKPFLQLLFSSKNSSHHFKGFLEVRARSCDFPDVAPVRCRRIQATAATRWKRACAPLAWVGTHPRKARPPYAIHSILQPLCDKQRYPSTQCSGNRALEQIASCANDIQKNKKMSLTECRYISPSLRNREQC